MANRSIGFRLRGLWLGLVFWVGFFLYNVDHHNVVDSMGRFAEQHWNWSRDGIETSLLVVAAACAVVAALIRTWASAYITGQVVHDTRLHSERIVADGPYRHVRNPLYLGTILVAIGFGFMASRIGFVVIVLGVATILWQITRTEEAGLLQSNPELYGDYLRAVPRFWPAWRARVPAGGQRPNWGNGIRSELYMWSFAAGLLAFEITRKRLAFYIGIILGVVILSVEGFLASRKR